MEKLGLGDARQIAAMLKGDEVAASKLSPRMADMLRQDGLLTVKVNGSRRKYLVNSMNREACRVFIAQQFGLKCSLEEWVDSTMATRGEMVGLTGNSKYQHIRTFRGFLVNSYDAIDATLGGRPFLISPLDGSSVFVNESDVFGIPEDVVVVGMENAENFMRIRCQRKLFDVIFPNRRLLFVSRYPQNAISDLREWLQRIPNLYVHFGDFDLAGIHIYLSEFYAYLGEKASFLIPDDIEERIKNGNPTLYDRQYARFKDMRMTDVRLCPLVDMIHHYRKGYEQEGYISAEL